EAAPSILQDPILISPQDGSMVTRSNPVLSAWDEDPAEAGTTQYRISTCSLEDCTVDVNVIVSVASDETLTEMQPTTFEASGLVNGETYHWCARNNNGTEQTDWIEMGEFIVNLFYPAGISYSTFLGGSGDDWASAISVDNGYIFVSGGTTSADFPT